MDHGFHHRRHSPGDRIHCCQFRYIYLLLAFLTVVARPIVTFAFVVPIAPKNCAGALRWSNNSPKQSYIQYQPSNNDNSNINDIPPRPIKKSPSKKKGTPRSRAKRDFDGGNKAGTTPRLPPPLLADYAINCASNWEEQTLRLSDSTIGTTCEHFEECSGCSIGFDVTDTTVVRAARRYFSKERFDGSYSNDRTFDEEERHSYPVIVPTATTGWRTQAKLAVANKSNSSWKKDGCLFGLYRKGSHELLPIPQCVVHHPSINHAIEVLEQATTKAGISAYSELSREGDLRYVQMQVERVTGRVALTLVWNASSLKECQPSLSRLVKTLNQNTVDAALWHSIWCHCNNGSGNNIFSRSPGRWHRLQGPEFLREPMAVAAAKDNSNTSNDAAGWLYFTPTAFRQGNMDGFDILALDVARAVPPGSKVCELYGGVGVLGLTALAYHYYEGNPLQWLRCSDENPANPRCFQRAVETLPHEMTGRSTNKSRRTFRPFDKGTEQNNSEGVTLGELAARIKEGQPVTDWSSQNVEASSEKTSYLIASAGMALQMGQALGSEVLIVDPPRRGLEDEVLYELCKPYNPDQPYVEESTLLTIPEDKIAWTNDVQTLIYVSCGFDALARDCDRLLSSNAGWKLLSSTGYLLFPGSDHIETLAIFFRR